ncbi:hypothetical protein BELL_0956g00020 [Botrytis elliptica]|uniref:Uncharacterized protein n=1 Tax=Botrytis elliptica TaxID=278938 RepID=A0A4Z1IY85_9HELO|nr:hypothetical protein BELL_0956g00020 [Botrytis elliptica]
MTKQIIVVATEEARMYNTHQLELTMILTLVITVSRIVAIGIKNQSTGTIYPVDATNIPHSIDPITISLQNPNTSKNRIEEWLPENECNGGDKQLDSHNVGSNEEMDWQLERELVIEGYEWSSEVSSLSRNTGELKDVTPDDTHEQTSNNRTDFERVVPNRCLDVELEDQSNGLAPG